MTSLTSRSQINLDLMARQFLEMPNYFFKIKKQISITQKKCNDQTIKLIEGITKLVRQFFLCIQGNKNDLATQYQKKLNMIFCLLPQIFGIKHTKIELLINGCIFELKFEKGEYLMKSTSTLSLRGGGCVGQKIKPKIQMQTTIPIDYKQKMKFNSQELVDKCDQLQDNFSRNDIMISLQWFSDNRYWISEICKNDNFILMLYDLALEQFRQLISVISVYLRGSGCLCYYVLEVCNDLLLIIYIVSPIQNFEFNKKRFFLFSNRLVISSQILINSFFAQLLHLFIVKKYIRHLQTVKNYLGYDSLSNASLFLLSTLFLLFLFISFLPFLFTPSFFISSSHFFFIQIPLRLHFILLHQLKILFINNHSLSKYLSEQILYLSRNYHNLQVYFAQFKDELQGLLSLMGFQISAN